MQLHDLSALGDLGSDLVGGGDELVPHAVRGRRLMDTHCDLRKFLNILRATTAAPRVFQAKSRFELAGHDNAGLSCLTDIRICNSLTEAEIHRPHSIIYRH